MLKCDLEAFYYLQDVENKPPRPSGISTTIHHTIFSALISSKSLLPNKKEEYVQNMQKLVVQLKDNSMPETIMYRGALELLIDSCNIAIEGKARKLKDLKLRVMQLLNMEDYPICNLIVLEFLLLHHQLETETQDNKFENLFITVFSFVMTSLSLFFAKKEISKDIREFALAKFDMSEKMKANVLMILNRGLRQGFIKSESIIYFIIALQSMRILKGMMKFKFNLMKIAVKFCFTKISRFSVEDKFPVKAKIMKHYDEIEIPENFDEVTIFMTTSLENYLFGHLSALANFTQKSNINEDVYEIFISYLLYFCLKNGAKNLFLNVMDTSFKVNSKFIIETCSLCYLSHDPYNTKGLNFLKTVCDREESLENMCILLKHLVYESHDYAYFMKTFDKVISLVDQNHQTPLLSYVWMLRGIMHLKVFGYSQDNIINPRQYFVKSLEIDDKNDLAHYHLARVDSICLNTQSASQHLDHIRFLNYEPIGYFTVLLFTTTKNYKDALSIIENNRYDDSYRLLMASLKINYLLNRKQSVRLISKKLVKFVDKKSRYKSNDTFQFMADTIDTKRSVDFTNLKNRTLLKDNKLSISMQSFDMQDSEETLNDAKYEEYCELAKIFLECNNVSYANFCLKKLEKTKPNAIEIIFIKALEAKIKMQNEKALQLFQQNLQLFPDDVQTMYHIGDLLIESGRIVAAKDYLEEAFRLENTNPNISKKLAFVYRKLGNIDSAKLYSSFSAQLSNSSPILDFKTTDLMIL